MKINKTCKAALDLHEQGFTPIPLVPGTKSTARKWDKWTADLSTEKIRRHFNRHPDHDLGILTEDGLFVADADTEQGVAALHLLEDSLDLTPRVVVKTARGEHHYYSLAEGVLAKSDAPDKSDHAERIDIKTGRAMVVVPPSPSKSWDIFDIEHVNDLTELTQEKVDAFYRHNGRDAPRPYNNSAQATTSASVSTYDPDRLRAFEAMIPRIVELLSHIDPDCGYNDWFRVGAALYSESCGSDAGFQVFNEWSAKGVKYRGSNETLKQWQALGRYSGKRITLATVAMLAEQGGADLAAISRKYNAIELLMVDDDLVDSTGKAHSTSDDSDNEQLDVHLLAPFSLRGKSKEMLEEMADQVVLPGNVIVIGQFSVWYGKPNTGKTLLLLWICIQAIKDQVIQGQRLYYVNADDTYRGLADKTQLAEEFSFEILAPSHNDFKAKNLLPLLLDIVKAGQAGETILILDTLKKFSSLMDKRDAAHFGRVAREFVSAGGTLIALAHTNKNPGEDGKPVYSGVTDFIDDGDCVYILDTLSEENDIRTVQFKNQKARGAVAHTAALSYSIKTGLSYRQILDSVVIVEEDTLKSLEEQVASLGAHPPELVDKITELIQRGYTAKGQLVQKAAESTKYGQHRIRETIDALTGTDPKKHRWKCEKGARGLMTYSVVTPDDPSDADGDRDKDPQSPDPGDVPY